MATATSLTVIPLGDRHRERHGDHPQRHLGVDAPSDDYTYNPAPDGHRGQPDQRTSAGGTSVTVTGTNLPAPQPSTSGREPGHLDRRGAGGHSLTVTSPAGAGTVNVTVTTPNGTSATTRRATSTPTTRRRRSPGSARTTGPQGGANTVTVTGTGFTGRHSRRLRARTRAPRSTWRSGASLTVTAPAGTGTVNVTVTTANGTSATTAERRTTPTTRSHGHRGQPDQRARAGGTNRHGYGHRVRPVATVDFGSTPAPRSTWRRRHAHGHLAGGDRHRERHGDHPQRHVGGQRTE